eukprot:CAMPEP_0204244098 /NCGR_PEP_ID=MMETSP0361-20130328/96812_1 /ASSEMBLY_ACC=CAM_ASM_000343 /TAXON_ID=268821 /ORGANISM="Scrippsiella Hangoei, Strain SHTV-5" /LENGTH=70 /DNA_ID=CAMNT_0051217077 /DNA_START=341 /DNA_END=549 /DNA_ORIENTATION=+
MAITNYSATRESDHPHGFSLRHAFFGLADAAGTAASGAGTDAYHASFPKKDFLPAMYRRAKNFKHSVCRV